MAYVKQEDKSSDVMHDFEVNKVIEGILLNIKSNVGPNNSMIYEIETKPEEVVGVWGSFILDNKMKKAEPGDKVKIEYTGKKVSEKTRRPYRTYDVWIDKDVNDVIDTSDLPF